MRAIWNDRVVAESDDTIVIEGNHYFPPGTVNMAYLRESSKTTSCFWKGRANYHDLVDGQVENLDAVWHYQDPKKRARQVQGYFAFWRGVTVTD
jgi:uncharacterized protein (DUF427 family)